MGTISEDEMTPNMAKDALTPTAEEITSSLAAARDIIEAYKTHAARLPIVAGKIRTATNRIKQDALSLGRVNQATYNLAIEAWHEACEVIDICGDDIAALLEQEKSTLFLLAATIETHASWLKSLRDKYGQE